VGRVWVRGEFVLSLFSPSLFPLCMCACVLLFRFTSLASCLENEFFCFLQAAVSCVAYAYTCGLSPSRRVAMPRGLISTALSALDRGLPVLPSLFAYREGRENADDENRRMAVARWLSASNRIGTKQRYGSAWCSFPSPLARSMACFQAKPRDARLSLGCHSGLAAWC
jgi:hypothetical protein